MMTFEYYYLSHTDMVLSSKGYARLVLFTVEQGIGTIPSGKPIVISRVYLAPSKNGRPWEGTEVLSVADARAYYRRLVSYGYESITVEEGEAIHARLRLG
jgi:hypothetical protein